MLRRSLSLGLLAGVGLGINVLSPQSASAAINLWYNSKQFTQAFLGPTGNLDGTASNFYVQGVISNVNETDVQIVLTTNFGINTHFLDGSGPGNDYGVAFNLTGVATAPTLLSCSVGPSIASANPAPNGNVCNTDDPPLNFDVDNLTFQASQNWDLTVNLPPSPFGSGNLTSSAGEIYTIVLKGLQESNFTGNTNPGPSSAYALGSISCIKAAGLSGTPASTAICSKIAPSGSISVPGPLPLLGVAAAFGYSRNIRNRILASRQQVTIS
jgi:hypothetical protein